MESSLFCFLKTALFSSDCTTVFCATESSTACSFPKIPSSWKMRCSARLVCFGVSFLDGPGTGKKLEKRMGTNSGECQRLQIDLEISAMTPKAVLFRTKTWKLWKLVATLGAGHRTLPGDVAGCCSGPGKLTWKEQVVLWLQAARVAVVALGLVLLCPQLLCFHWHRRLSWADLTMGAVRSRLKLWRLLNPPAGLLTPSGQAIA